MLGVILLGWHGISAQIIPIDIALTTNPVDRKHQVYLIELPLTGQAQKLVAPIPRA
jgi:hypothetical protein